MSSVPTGSVTDLRLAVRLALDWRKCGLGALGVAMWLLGAETVVAASTLGMLHLTDLLVDGAEMPAPAVIAWIAAIALWGVVCAARFGVAIARLAAVELASGKRAPAGAGWRHARRHRRSVWWSSLGFALATAVLLVPAFVLGLLGRFGAFGEVLVAIGLLPVLACALIAVALAACGILGWPLVLGAVACDASDAFDAATRSIVYLCGQPVRAAVLRLISLALGAASLGVAVALAVVAWEVAHAAMALAWGGGDGPAHLREPLGLALVGDWRAIRPGAGALYAASALAYGCAVAGFGASYSASSAVIQYLVLRHHVDGTPIHDVELDEDDRADAGDLVYDSLLLDFDVEPGDERRADRRVADAHP